MLIKSSVVGREKRTKKYPLQDSMLRNIEVSEVSENCSGLVEIKNGPYTHYVSRAQYQEMLKPTKLSPLAHVYSYVEHEGKRIKVKQ